MLRPDRSSSDKEKVGAVMDQSSLSAFLIPSTPLRGCELELCTDSGNGPISFMGFMIVIHKS